MIEKVIKYILNNGPVSHTTLEASARKKGLTLTEFDKVMTRVAKHFQISATVRGDDVWYQAKKSRPRTPQAPLVMPPYPREELGECPFKICFCAMWRTDDDEIFDPDKHGHRPDCDAVLYSELYKRQNLIRRVL